MAAQLRFHRRYTDNARGKILEAFRTSGLSIRKFAKKEEIPFTTLSDWNSKDLKDRPRKQKTRTSSFPQLEEELDDWIDQKRSLNLAVLSYDIRAEALKTAARIGTPKLLNFKASKGRFYKFLKRRSYSLRVPTHRAKKTEFTQEDMVSITGLTELGIPRTLLLLQKLKLDFFNPLIETIKVNKVPLDRIINLDQTMVRLVNPEKKTYNKTGAKEINVTNPPGEKEGFTITLAVRASGEKLPAVIVFKGNKVTGILSPRIMKTLKIPPNIIVKSSRSAWWFEDLDREWIDNTFPLGTPRSALIRVDASAHKTIPARFLMEERNLEEIKISPGLTGELQPLDVGINKPLKEAGYRLYHERRINTPMRHTKKGYLVKPSRQQYIDFISKAWDEIRPEIVPKSFARSFYELDIEEFNFE